MPMHPTSLIGEQFSDMEIVRWLAVLHLLSNLMQQCVYRVAYADFSNWRPAISVIFSIFFHAISVIFSTSQYGGYVASSLL